MMKLLLLACLISFGQTTKRETKKGTNSEPNRGDCNYWNFTPLISRKLTSFMFSPLCVRMERSREITARASERWEINNHIPSGEREDSEMEIKIKMRVAGRVLADHQSFCSVCSGPVGSQPPRFVWRCSRAQINIRILCVQVSLLTKRQCATIPKRRQIND